MHILVIGGSKGIGLEVVKYGLERGHRMRVFARSANDIGLDDPGLEKMAGDALRESDVARAVDGVDAVVMALGLPKSPTFALRKSTLFETATQVLIPAMRSAGVDRLLAVTGFGAGESRAKISSLERIPFRLIFERAYDDKSRQEELIKASGLKWTIARPGILTSNRRSGRYQVLIDLPSWRNGMIPRADVAHFLIHAAEDGSHVHEAPVLVR